ncbi:MAG: Flp family type IVb pilin [Armatimonadota bacterium]|jgi:Flp pilus assembly pilin Flp
MWRSLQEFIPDDEGMTSVEYALLLALVVVSAMTAWRSLDTSVSNAAERTAESMTTTN